jgi:integration host factor subunit beta
MAGSAEIAKLVPGVTSSGVQAVVDAILQVVKTEGEVNFRGFGTFTKKDYDPYVGRNPKTGEAVNVPAKSKLHFKPSKMISFAPVKKSNRSRG